MDFAGWHRTCPRQVRQSYRFIDTRDRRQNMKGRIKRLNAAALSFFIVCQVHPRYRTDFARSRPRAEPETYRFWRLTAIPSATGCDSS